MRPTVKITSHDTGNQFLGDALAKLTRKKALVGIPASNADRRFALQTMLKQAKMGAKRRARFVKGMLSDINNAQVLYIFTNGSPLHKQPPRPLVEPAITDPANNELICEQLEKAMDAALDDKDATPFLNKAGQVAENACRKWFTNPKNGWAPNAPSTVRRKGSSRVGIDLAEMRKALTHVVVEKN